MSGVDPGASAGTLFGPGGVGSRVSPRKELRAARRSSLEQGQSTSFSLQNRKAVIVRFYPTYEKSIPVIKDMVAGYGGPNVGRRLQDIVDGLLGGDVLHDQLKFWHISYQWLHNILYEEPLPVKDIDCGTSYLRVDAQDQA